MSILFVTETFKINRSFYCPGSLFLLQGCLRVSTGVHGYLQSFNGSLKFYMRWSYVPQKLHVTE